MVYGSRFLGGEFVRLHFFWHYLANKLLTFFCNIITNLNMSDMETGYKLIKRELELDPKKASLNAIKIWKKIKKIV